MEHNRLVIYSKDIATITGKTERYARTLMSKIRKALGKANHHLISVKEFCEFTGLSVEEVMRYLR
jgi:hypothetical protein